MANSRRRRNPDQGQDNQPAPQPAPPAQPARAPHEIIADLKKVVGELGEVSLFIATIISPDIRALWGSGWQFTAANYRRVTQQLEVAFQDTVQRASYLLLAILGVGILVILGGAHIQYWATRWAFISIVTMIDLALVVWLGSRLIGRLVQVSVILGLATQTQKSDLLKSGLLNPLGWLNAAFGGVQQGVTNTINALGMMARLLGRTILFVVATAMYFQIFEFWKMPGLVNIVPLIIMALFTGLIFWTYERRPTAVRVIVWIQVILITMLALMTIWCDLVMPWLSMHPTDGLNDVTSRIHVSMTNIVVRLVITAVLAWCVRFAIRRASGTNSAMSGSSAGGGAGSSGNTRSRQSAWSLLFLLPALFVIVYVGFFIYKETGGFTQVTSPYVNHGWGIFKDPNIRNGVGGIPPSLPRPRSLSGTSGLAQAATLMPIEEIRTLPAKSGWQTTDIMVDPEALVIIRVTDDAYQVRFSDEEWMDASCAGYTDRQTGKPIIPADNPDQTIAGGCPAARLPGFGLLVRGGPNGTPQFCGSGIKLRFPDKRRLEFAFNVPIGPDEDANYRGDIRIVVRTAH